MKKGSSGAILDCCLCGLFGWEVRLFFGVIITEYKGVAAHVAFEEVRLGGVFACFLDLFGELDLRVVYGVFEGNYFTPEWLVGYAYFVTEPVNGVYVGDYFFALPVFDEDLSCWGFGASDDACGDEEHGDCDTHTILVFNE
jgi:hypothetical protein